jgi:CheY-like chemotaxis protein
MPMQPMPQSDPIKQLPTILLIDDDAICREVLSMMLEISGFVVQAAEDGAGALELIGPGFAPEVVLMDTQMPGLSGLELMQALRSRCAAHIVAISGSEPGEAIREAADGFLLKPIEIDDVMTLLGDAVLVAEPDAILGRILSVEAAGVDEAEVGAAVSQPVLDLVVLGKLRAMMPAAAVLEIYSAVASDLNMRLPVLESAMNSANIAEVRRIAHAIKGGCSMVGFTLAAETASRLETSNTPEAWPKELLQLHDALTALQGILGGGLP